MDIRGRSTWNVLRQKASKHHTLNFHHYFTISEKRTQRLRHQIGGQQDQLREGDHQGNADEGSRNKRHQCGEHLADCNIHQIAGNVDAHAHRRSDQTNTDDHGDQNAEHDGGDATTIKDTTEIIIDGGKVGTEDWASDPTENGSGAL